MEAKIICSPGPRVEGKRRKAGVGQTQYGKGRAGVCQTAAIPSAALTHPSARCVQGYRVDGLRREVATPLL